MQNRCYRKNTTRYADYGGRGIKVYRAWRGPGGFEKFLAHVGERPSSKHSLDRKENDKGYVPGNVRWVIRTEQMRNTRRTILLSFRGLRKSLRVWCEDVGLSFPLVYQRIYVRGWPLAKALTTPNLHDEKLDAAKVERIRAQRKCGMSVAQLAKGYSVAKSTIYDACSGRTW